MKMLLKKIFLIIVMIFLTDSLLFAEKILFSADNMSGQTGDSSSTSLNGHAYIKTDSMEISADKIELSGKEYRNIIAEGNVSGKNLESQLEFQCETMEYDRETKIATLKGSVNLVDTEKDVKATAQIIEYNQETNIAILQIQVNLIQKKNICQGAYAVYQKNQQMLEISGNAEVKQDKDTFRAQQISLNLDTQDIVLAGNVKGTVTAENSKKDDAAKHTDNNDKSPKLDSVEKADTNSDGKKEDSADNVSADDGVKKVDTEQDKQ